MFLLHFNFFRWIFFILNFRAISPLDVSEPCVFASHGHEVAEVTHVLDAQMFYLFLGYSSFSVNFRAVSPVDVSEPCVS